MVFYSRGAGSRSAWLGRPGRPSFLVGAVCRFVLRLSCMCCCLVLNFGPASLSALKSAALVMHVLLSCSELRSGGFVRSRVLCPLLNLIAMTAAPLELMSSNAGCEVRTRRKLRAGRVRGRLSPLVCTRDVCRPMLITVRRSGRWDEYECVHIKRDALQDLM